MELRYAVAAGITLCLLLAGGETLFAAEAGQVQTPKIGFVNLKKVFEQYERSKTMEKEIEAFQGEENAKLEKLKKEADELEKESDLVVKNTKEWFKIKSDVLRKRKELETDEKLAKMEITRRLLKATEEIYEDILKKISDYASAHGFMMVLKIETEKVECDTHTELTFKVNSRSVLYFKTEFEITDDIVKELNLAYSGKPPDGGDKEPGKEEGKKDETKKDEGKKEGGSGEEKKN